LVAVTGVADRGVRRADLGVLVPARHDPATAACLAEIAFLTNPAESARLSTDAYRQQIAQALTTAVLNRIRVPAAVGAPGGGGAQSLGIASFMAERLGQYLRNEADQGIPLDPGVGGQSIGEGALEIGDIIVSTTSHLSSRGIRFGTGSLVSHAKLYIGGSQVVEAVGDGVVLRSLAESLADDTLAVAFRYPGITHDQQLMVRDFAGTQLGRAYNYVGIVRQALFQIESSNCDALPGELGQTCRRWVGRVVLGPGNSDTFFCSQLILAAYANALIPLTSTPPSWTSPGDIVGLELSARLGYVGHLKAPAAGMALSASRVIGASVPGLNGNGHGNGRAYASDLAAGIGGYGAPARPASGAAPGLHRAAARAREYSSTYARTAAIVEPDVDYAATSLEEANLIWQEWLNRYAEWRKGVPAASLTSFPHAAICQLRLSDAAGRRAYGTGFYIGNETLLTCGHNFLDAADGWETTSVEVQPGFSPVVSTLATQTFGVVARDVIHPRWRDTADATHDLAVVRVPGLPAAQGTFTLANRSLGENEGIVVCGYGKVDGSDYAAQGQRMDGAHIAQADTEMVYYPIQTVGGHSGSPVFSGSTVIGVHTGPRMAPAGGIDPHQNRAVLLNPGKIDWINQQAGTAFGQSLGTNGAYALADENSPQAGQSDEVRHRIARSLGLGDAEIRTHLDAVGSQGDPWYPFIDGGMGAITEVAAVVLVLARHDVGAANFPALLRDTIAVFGGEAELGRQIVRGTATELDFLGQMSQQVALRSPENQRRAIGLRYGTLRESHRTSRVSYYFNPR
ncbi:MAG: hypothetical protein QOH66_1833, partial [Actinomycetota bacterium]|nr:hypothetical protein [Actinomycetota bacterium]